MKLTEDDKVVSAFFVHINDDGFGLFLSHNKEKAEKKLQQILRNQEDAEKWQGYEKMCSSGIIHEDGIYKLQQIKNRLKKRIEEIEIDVDTKKLWIVIELQKILGAD